MRRNTSPRKIRRQRERRAQMVRNVATAFGWGVLGLAACSTVLLWAYGFGQML